MNTVYLCVVYWMNPEGTGNDEDIDSIWTTRTAAEKRLAQIGITIGESPPEVRKITLNTVL
ncbi:hypothetical protein J2Y69_002125 [Microbacterium resistens]|uniref:Uncharacterized protein n=1 Tax=Microbacterium resistens TaxID=156977 RepID=A0ABU1SD32_9MICO|nr:hypothetical protein [Microbacterium resistens]MDR6867521.1 hypothetical protein [Microbacterium resistens]